MSREKVNAALDTAKGHMQNAREAAHTNQETAHEIWQTIGSLVAAPNRLGFLQSKTIFWSGMEKGLTPNDVTAMVEGAALSYSNARAELSGAREGSNNDHLNNAGSHLNNAVGLLHEDTMDATTRAKMVEANFEELSEGVKKILGLLYEMNDVARELESSVGSHVLHAQNSINAIQRYQDGSL